MERNFFSLEKWWEKCGARKCFYAIERKIKKVDWKSKCSSMNILIANSYLKITEWNVHQIKIRAADK